MPLSSVQLHSPTAPEAGLLCSVAGYTSYPLPISSASHLFPALGKVCIYLVYLFTDKNVHCSLRRMQTPRGGTWLDSSAAISQFNIFQAQSKCSINVELINGKNMRIRQDWIWAQLPAALLCHPSMVLSPPSCGTGVVISDLQGLSWL